MHGTCKRTFPALDDPGRLVAGSARMHLGVVIRFKNSAKTLPEALAALHAQTLQPDLILGIDTGSTDGSPALLQAAGARLMTWAAPYHHSKVLNFAIAACPAERVLVLSSHTVLESADALAKLDEAMDDPETACASAKWCDDDDYYGDAITWQELCGKGLKLASIYSNSFGLLRRSFWEETPFDETVPGMEDYVWAVEQVRRGRVCRRVEFGFSYLRQGHSRDYVLTACAFRLASKHGLRMCWLGVGESVRRILRLSLAVMRERPSQEDAANLRMYRDRLLGALFWRFCRAATDD
jgi:hypothetical protein